MNGLWFAAAGAMLPAFALAVAAVMRGALGARFVALQLVSTLAVLMIVMLAIAFGQPSSLDLAVGLALLGLPGTLLLAVFVERWL